jgi:hypothetical protein
MYSQERELKKLRHTVRNKARVNGCIAEAFTCKDITNILSLYFSCANNMAPCSKRCSTERAINFSKAGKGVGAPTAQYVTNKEWNYFMLYMYTNMEEVQPYFEKFDKTYWTSCEQPTLKQLDHMRENGLKCGPSFPKWFRQHVIYLFILSLS